MNTPENTVSKQTKYRFQPGQSGNPGGKPKGTRHKATQIAQALLNGECEALTRQIIKQALAGDLGCLKVCIERLIPPMKASPVDVDLPEVNEARDLPRVTGAILYAVARGELTPSEGQSIASLLETHRRALEISELENRLTALELVIKEKSICNE